MVDITQFLEARIVEDERKAGALLTATQEGYDINEYAERMLAECAAKRAIIDMYKPEDANDESWGSEVYMAGAYEDCVLALAAVYKDHPDYQPDWSA